MKNKKIFNDFETLATYNFVGNKKIDGAKLINKKEGVNESVSHNETKSQQQPIQPDILITSPASLEDINKTILCLKKSQPIIVDLTYKKSELTQKVLNYLNGAVFALGGSINKLTNNIYIILPQGTQINFK